VIRVIHVMGRMAPGGTEHQLVGMLEAAQGRYWHATLCVLSSGWELTTRVRAAGVPIVELDGVNKLDVRRAIRLRRLAKEADVVHASLWGASAFARVVTAGPRRPALVISERGVEDHRRPPADVINRMLRPVTDGFIGNSTAVTDFIRASHGVAVNDPRLAAIPNGLDPSTFYPIGTTDHPRKRSRLVGVGRLVPSKRFDLAISVLAQLEKATDIELVIAGDGPERGRLESMARGLPVTFLGHVSDRGALADLLRTSDVLVMPSASEGYPNAVLEALACGLPVVASDVPGMRAVAGVGVRLVDDNTDDWCKAIGEALAAPRVTSPQIADRILSFDEVARRHLDVFEAAVARRHHGRGGGQVSWRINETRPEARHE
jgi:glycosyltransferase involved in cell wall biosynthesis